MTGELYLNDRPGELAGGGKSMVQEDLQAATKFYVDNTAYSSSTNLFVATSGDDLMKNVKKSQGKEGTGWTYVLQNYKSGNAKSPRTS